MCPRCRQNAPLVYRGVSAYCTACGAPRMPLAASSVNLAGQPSKVGGTVARVFGWLVLAGGLLLAALLAGLILLLNGPGVAAAVVGGPIALIASIVAWALLRGGKELKHEGEETELATKNRAIFALANTRGGVLTAWDVAQMLQITPKEGDDILTKLAKEYPDYVTLDVDDNGTVLYRVIAAAWQNVPGVTSGFAPNAPAQHVRVAPPARVAEPVRVDPREPIEEEVEDAAEPMRQRSR